MGGGEGRGPIGRSPRSSKPAPSSGADGDRQVARDIQAIIAKPLAERTAWSTRSPRLAYRQVTQEQGRDASAGIKGDEKKRWEALHKQLSEFDAGQPVPPPRLQTVTDVGPFAPPTGIPGDRAAAGRRTGLPHAAGSGTAKGRRPPAANSTGRRTALARWLTRPDNPLPARVIVNRLWQYHFGRGLVATASDFGRLGERAEPPGAARLAGGRLAKQGWRLKRWTG